MSKREDLIERQKNLQNKIAELRKNNNSKLPVDVESFEKEFQDKNKKIYDDWNKLLNNITSLKKNVETESNPKIKESLEKQLEETKVVADAMEKQIYEMKKEYNTLVEQKDYQAYELCYCQLKQVNQELADLEAKSQAAKPSVTINVISTPEVDQQKTVNKKLPGWVTSFDRTKTIHLAENLLGSDKEWFEKFIEKHKLTMSPLQDDQSLELKSKNNSKEVITVAKNTVSAVFDDKDVDKWVNIVVEMYVRSIKGTSCQRHAIKTINPEFQPKFEKALKAELESNGLLTDETMINGKKIRDHSYSEDKKAKNIKPPSI